MAVMEISVVPLGKGSSVSSYVADCIRVLKKEKMPFELTAMGTNVEEVLRILLLSHSRCIKFLSTREPSAW